MEIMDIEELKETLKTYPMYFLQVMGGAPFNEGWKLSIQGRTLDDVGYLAQKLFHLLGGSRASFKFGTQKLIDLKHPQQSTKLLTIYIPNNVDPKSFAELVRLNLLDYKGAKGIPKPESYNVYSKEFGIYYRNDRDENGEYIPAN